MRRSVLVMLASIVICAMLTADQAQPVSGQTADAISFAPYDIGLPVVSNVYVSVTGNDANNGSSPNHALRTLAAAWERIPQGVTLANTGYHILLLPGKYAPEDAPNYWESRYGTYTFPILIEAANGADTVWLPSVNLFDVRYVYFINLNSEPSGDVFHCEKCDHVLLRGNRFIGANPDTYVVQETVKINQSQHVYVENNDFSGAWDNAVDFVAVQYGHFFGNRIHNAGDWCMYLKGGSAYFTVAGNVYYDCGTGGFTAGQGTGFQYMLAPWLQYEAYDIKFVNNVIHDTSGAGAGVQGGYNILLAYNTLYRIGGRSHLLELGFGSRSCDGQVGDEGRDRCANNQTAGGWGNQAAADGINYVRIPNQHVYIYNNLVLNPDGFQSAYQHLLIFAPYSGDTQVDSNVANPVLADDNLQIRGNVIVNGDAAMPLGVEVSSEQTSGCQTDNLTCNEMQLRTDNAINTLAAPLIDPSQGDYRLEVSLTMNAMTIPDFGWSVSAPQGTLSNAITVDFAGTSRTGTDQIGAFAANAPPIKLSMNSARVISRKVHTVIYAPTPTTTLVATETPTAATAVPPLPSGPITVVALGDSLTEGAEDNREEDGYPGRLIKQIAALRPDSNMLNFGHSGWNSDALISGDQGLPSELDEAITAISKGVVAPRPSIALVWIGSNDLFYLYEYNDPDEAAEQADLDHYSQNLDTILSSFSEIGTRVIIAKLDDQSLRPVVQRGEAFPGTSKAEVQRMSAQVRRYNEVIAQKAAEYGAITVDFFETTIFTDPATLADDGNHPNADGYDQISDIWLAALRPLLVE